MAQAVNSIGNKARKFGTIKKTSIGASNNSRPTNKHAKRSWKKYRGQGK